MLMMVNLAVSSSSGVGFGNQEIKRIALGRKQLDGRNMSRPC